LTYSEENAKPQQNNNVTNEGYWYFTKGTDGKVVMHNAVSGKVLGTNFEMSTEGEWKLLPAKYRPGIVITKSEMDIIQSFNDIKKEKIVFVLIALAKYFNALYGNDRDCCFAKTRDIFKYARVVIPTNERDYYLHFAYESGVLLPNFSIGSNMQLVGVISHTEEESVLVLDEHDYKELAYAYLNYKNGGYKKCKECGAWFKVKSSEPNLQYCHLHKPQEYNPIGNKILECIDCGELFSVDSRNMTKCRCDDCQIIYRRKWDRERKQKLKE
jgi:hypothetical protein